jgi:hypothetical protein
MCGLLRILIPPTKLLKSHGNKKQLPLVFFVLLSLPLFHPPTLCQGGHKRKLPAPHSGGSGSNLFPFLYKSA